MTDWDADSDQLHANLHRLLSLVARDVLARVIPTVEAARRWHEMMMQGLTSPRPECVGRFRGEVGLEHVGVRIGTRFGVPSHEVASALQSFESRLQRAVGTLDVLIAPNFYLSADQVAAVIDLCAWVHSEWVRIHPFVNGNGRIARLWANFIAMRYGLPPFVRLRPRPSGAYGAAAGAAMDGHWETTARLFRRMYDESIRG